MKLKDLKTISTERATNCAVYITGAEVILEDIIRRLSTRTWYNDRIGFPLQEFANDSVFSDEVLLWKARITIEILSIPFVKECEVTIIPTDADESVDVNIDIYLHDDDEDKVYTLVGSLSTTKVTWDIVQQ